jgi:amino-acid N-acetyltransferase
MQQYMSYIHSCISSSSFSFVLIVAFTFFSYQGGVQRVHIIDGTVGGSLLLELFTRDGVGTMIARYSRMFF